MSSLQVPHSRRLRRAVGALMSVGLALVAGSCRDRSITGASPRDPHRTIDVETARLQLNLTYDGQPLRESGIGSECGRLEVDGQFVSWMCGSSALAEGLSPGEHTVEFSLDNYWQGTATHLLGPVTVSLAAGQTTTRVIDVSDRYGLVTGRLTINGEPARNYSYMVCTAVQCDQEFGPDGTFQLLAAPGSGTAAVVTLANPRTPLATFGFTAAAGQTTVVGTVEGGASGYTPAGEGIAVKPVDPTTSTTPVTLKFSAVTSGGNTRVTTGGHGPPPPTGTRPGQPTVYYTIETTAGFTGSVLVCINYGEGWFGNESRLGIYHADASGTWTDVTTSRDPATNVVCGTVSSFSTFLVAERNVAPVVGAITIADPLVPVGTAVGVHATFTDENPRDTHTATVAWDDGAVSPASITESGGAGTLAAQHTYAAQGVYTLTVRVSDDPLTGTRTSAGDAPAYVVVYDGSAGFVSGGGWITSPAGACRTAACTATGTGRATFGFVARYRPGAWTPSGSAEFEFRAGGLRFSSNRYDWLVPAGARAQFKGAGQINGAGDYGFLITAIDGALLPGGGADRFRIKIWDVATGAVVYDNQLGSGDDSDAATELGGGSIVIHR